MQTESIRPSAAQTDYAPANAGRKTGAGKQAQRTADAGGGAWPADAGVRVDVIPEKGRVPDEDTPPRRDVASGRAALDMAALTAAVHAFTNAYNTLLETIHRKRDEAAREQTRTDEADGYAQAAEAFRAAVYQPVVLEEQTTRRVSLYEMGVAHSPNHRTAGQLTVNDAKLAAAVNTRENDARVLFAGAEESLPARMRALLLPFLEQTESESLRGCGDVFLAACDGLRNFFILSE